MIHAVDNARAELEKAFMSGEAHQLLGKKLKPVRP